MIFLSIDAATFTFTQACLLLSKISPEIVGKPLEISRQYDGINVLMSFMVSIIQTYVTILQNS